MISSGTAVVHIVSIHALAKRATHVSDYCYQHRWRFNPRPREEGDGAKPLINIQLLVSIHALAKRATVL